MFRSVSLPSKEAILIMDSRSSQSGLRHSGLSASWSKLYKAGGVYLDLSLKSEGSGAVLLGQVIAESKHPRVHSLSLHGVEGTAVATSPVNEYGGFRLELKEKGDYSLEFNLGAESFKVDGLEVF
ncbi:MAG: hypothetical protein IVW51_01245 [Thermaceae bacterium]|nr:hypothetical protein [Thermaceae bacterium]